MGKNYREYLDQNERVDAWTMVAGCWSGCGDAYRCTRQQCEPLIRRLDEVECKTSKEADAGVCGVS